MKLKNVKNRSSRANRRIKVGSEVMLTSGYKDYRGKVYRVRKIRGDKLVLDGFKTVKRAMKITQENHQNFAEKDIWVHLSNVALVDDGKPARIKAEFGEDKKKFFVFKKSGNKVEN